jgi:hypothetical protein
VGPHPQDLDDPLSGDRNRFPGSRNFVQKSIQPLAGLADRYAVHAVDLLAEGVDCALPLGPRQDAGHAGQAEAQERRPVPQSDGRAAGQAEACPTARASQRRVTSPESGWMVTASIQAVPAILLSNLSEGSRKTWTVTRLAEGGTEKMVSSGFQSWVPVS